MNEQHKLDSLLGRVPFTSLPWIIGLMVGCGLICFGGVIALIVNRPVQPELGEHVLYVCGISGMCAFLLSSLLPRRKKYRESFEEMLSRSPVVSWNYNDTEWEEWLRFVERLDFERKRNTKGLLIFVTLVGLIVGKLLSMMRSEMSFASASLFCISVLWITVAVQYLYWRHLRRDWDQGPSEVRIFEDGVFFHHLFLDWKGDPDKGVLVKVKTEDQPIATLTVEMQNGRAKLAPRLREFIVPIPHDQIDDATQLARSLSQNVNLPEEDA